MWREFEWSTIFISNSSLIIFTQFKMVTVSLNRAGDKVAVKPYYPFSLNIPYVQWQPNKKTAVNGPVCESDETKWNQPVEVTAFLSFFFLLYHISIVAAPPSHRSLTQTPLRWEHQEMAWKVIFYTFLFFSKASIQFVQHVCKEMETEFMAVRKEEKQLCLIASSQITQNCLDIRW